MQEYKYIRYTWRDGKLVAKVQMTMSSQKLYEISSSVGELTFLRLINRWNSQPATKGENEGGLVHKYVVVVV